MSKRSSVFSWLKEEEFKKILEELSKQRKKSKASILFDMKKYNRRYKADYHDYKYFKMYDKTSKENNTYITKGINEDYIEKYNNGEIIVPNKVKVHTSKLPNQNSELNHINKKPCIFKFLVFKENIITCVLELTNNKPLYAHINIDTGIIDYPAIDLNGKLYEKSPSTKEDLTWFRIPKWPRICRFVQTTASNLKDYQYIEIDIYLDEEGPIITGINNPTYYIYQLHIDDLQEVGINYIIKEKENEK